MQLWQIPCLPQELSDMCWQPHGRDTHWQQSTGTQMRNWIVDSGAGTVNVIVWGKIVIFLLLPDQGRDWILIFLMNLSNTVTPNWLELGNCYFKINFYDQVKLKALHHGEFQISVFFLVVELAWGGSNKINNCLSSFFMRNCFLSVRQAWSWPSYSRVYSQGIWVWWICPTVLSKPRDRITWAL